MMDKDEMKEGASILHANVESCIDTVFLEGNLKDFLKTAAYFPQMDYKNQLLLYKQRPDATIVAGEEAYKNCGRGLVNYAKPIFLLYPTFERTAPGRIRIKDGEFVTNPKTGDLAYDAVPVYSAIYKPVAVYDISETTGEVFDVSYDLKNTENRIRYLTRYSVRGAEGDELGENQQARLDEFGRKKRKTGHFLYKRSLEKEERRCQLALLYSDYLIGHLGIEDGTEELPEFINDNYMKLLCRLIVGRRFGIGDKCTFYILPEVAEWTHEQKKTFIRRLSELSSEIIMDLSEYCLTFNELAIANSLLRIGSDMDRISADMNIRFMRVASSIQDQGLKREIAVFRDKLFATAPGYLEAMIKNIHKKKLFSYPPYELKLDITDEKEDEDDDR